MSRHPNKTRHWSFWDRCPKCGVTKRFLVSELPGIIAMGRCPTCTTLVKVTQDHRGHRVYEG